MVEMKPTTVVKTVKLWYGGSRRGRPILRDDIELTTGKTAPSIRLDNNFMGDTPDSSTELNIKLEGDCLNTYLILCNMPIIYLKDIIMCSKLGAV